MCDERTIKESLEYMKRSGELTRRQFNVLSAGAGLCSRREASRTAPDARISCNLCRRASSLCSADVVIVAMVTVRFELPLSVAVERAR